MFKEIEKYFDEDWKDWNGLFLVEIRGSAGI